MKKTGMAHFNLCRVFMNTIIFLNRLCCNIIKTGCRFADIAPEMVLNLCVYTKNDNEQKEHYNYLLNIIFLTLNPY